MALRRALVGLLPKALGAPTQSLAPICSASNSVLMQSVTSTSTSTSSHVPQSFRELWRSYATDLAAPAKTTSAPCTKLSLTPSHLISYDEHSHQRYPPSADQKPFTYLVVAGGRFMYASAIRLFVLKFVMSLSAAADVLALSSLEVDLGGIEEGQCVTVKWRGKPVFIKHRTDEEIAKANDVNLADLRDAQTDAERVVNPKYLIVVGICTHLGCVPIAGAGEYGGWFCPCHGSHYDISGRIRKGPAPYNLEVPEYRFLDEKKIVVG